MSSKIKSFLQYAVILSATIFLVWLSLRGIQVSEGENKWQYILNTWKMANKSWLLLMVLLFMISNFMRAERWRMLLYSSGNPTSLYHSILSVMIGYMVNLAIPRGGEVSRCYNLYKLDKTPVEVSFGTVVVERIVDIVFLIIVLVLAFAFEFDKLIAFIKSLPIQPFLGGKKLMVIFLIGLSAIAIVWVLLRVLRKNQKIIDLLNKVWSGFKTGLVSISKLESKGMFLFHSVGIWVMYFLMTYAVIKAFDETGHLGMNAVLSIFAIGTIAMAAPLPGGAGSYHVLIPAGLVLLYQLPKANAVAFTFVYHGWQTLILIVGGVISLLLTSILLRKKVRPVKKADSEDAMESKT